jgi:hypothetical protein
MWVWFFKKGFHPLFLVFRRKEDVEITRIMGQGCVEIHVEAFVDEPLEGHNGVSGSFQKGAGRFLRLFREEPHRYDLVRKS